MLFRVIVSVFRVTLAVVVGMKEVAYAPVSSCGLENNKVPVWFDEVPMPHLNAAEPPVDETTIVIDNLPTTAVAVGLTDMPFAKYEVVAPVGKPEGNKILSLVITPLMLSM